MAKTTIIEAQNSNTSFDQNSSNGTLGKLAGIFADYKNGTRNSDRLYTEELWDNRVFGSEDVMEALETKTLFGELDHPDGDRCETLAKNAAISITKLEKRPEEGVIYGEAEILDTPTGRIVKALADSGAKLGISSRGMGEEKMENGQNIIDPETYDFITFDVVVTPANTKARVSLTESKHITKLTESLKKEIDDCETKNQLDQVKNVVETIQLTNKEELAKLIETKLNELEDDDTEDTEANGVEVKVESKELSEEDKAIALKLLESKYLKIKAEYKESLKLNESLQEENKQLIEKRDLLKKTIKTRVDKLNEVKKENSKLTMENKQLKRNIQKVEESNRKENNNLLREYREAIIRSNGINKKKVEKLNNDHKDELNKLQKQLNSETQKFNNILEENNKIVKKLEANSKIILERDSMIKKLQEQLETEKLNTNKKLLENKKLEESQITKLQQELNKVLEENKQLKTLNENFSELAFSPMDTRVQKEYDALDYNDFDADDQALFNALL